MAIAESEEILSLTFLNTEGQSTWMKIVS